MEAATGAEDAEKETQPTYSVGDMVELNGHQYEVMAIVMDIATITEGVNSSIQDFLAFYLPADAFRMMYPDNTLRKLFFDVSEECQPQAETMLIDEGLYYAVSTLFVSYILSAFGVLVGVRMMVAGDWTATFHFTLLPLIICTPILIVFAVLIPYICFKNLEKQSIVERLRLE